MAAKFWVGGGTNTNWNSSPVTNWANSSGGTGNQTAPTTGDDVTFDNASGTGASVWNTAISLNSLKCSASRNTVTHSNNIGITISGGDLELPGGVGATYAPGNVSSSFTISGTSGTQKITSNGKNLAALVLNGVAGTFQLQDNLNCSAIQNSAITLTNGTFDCQTFTVQTGIFNSNNANTRVLKGSGTWTLNAPNTTGTIWNVTATLTVTNFTSTITISELSSATVRTFAGAGLSYGPLVISAGSSGVWLIFTGANTFSSLTPSGPNYLVFPSSTTTTITNASSPAGSAGNEIGFISSTLGTSATISCASGTLNFSWCAFRDITFSGGATFGADNSFDLGHNSGITINAPTGGPPGQQCM